MLDVKKTVVGELEYCYSLAMLHYKGKDHFLCAAEQSAPCYLISLDGKTIEETIWEGPGGAMTMVQVPGTDGQFLATRKFYSPDNSKESSLVIVTPKALNQWEVRTLCDMPFVHRFDILQAHGKKYIIACTLKSDHQHTGDWRFPGKILVAELPEDLSSYNDDNQLQFTPIKEGLLKNHGYCRYTDDQGNMSSIVSCDNGVFHVYPPTDTDKEWQCETLTTDAASDGLMVDLDGDGVEELCTFTPFHGNEVRIYRKENGKYELVYTYPEKLPFLHALWGGELCGKNTWVLGYRNGDRQLLAITYEDGEYKAQELDRGRGAANLLHYVYDNKDIISAANRESSEIARYELTKA